MEEHGLHLRPGEDWVEGCRYRTTINESRAARRAELAALPGFGNPSAAAASSQGEGEEGRGGRGGSRAEEGGASAVELYNGMRHGSGCWV